MAMMNGEQVPDRVLIEMMEERLSRDDCADGFSLEGIPRTMEQAALIDQLLASKGLEIDVALSLDAGNDDWNASMDDVFSWYDRQGKLAVINANMYVEEVQMAVADVIGKVQMTSETQLSAVAATSEIDPTKIRWIDPRRSSSSAIGTRTMNYIFGTQHAKQYHSNTRMREDMRRHERMKHDPNEKYEEQMASSMEYGWRAKAPELYMKDPEMFHPRMKSRETAYSEALILGPRHP